MKQIKKIKKIMLDCTWKTICIRKRGAKKKSKKALE
jgi:hypothetical protein